jgi:uncharacterized membrane protein
MGSQSPQTVLENPPSTGEALDASRLVGFSDGVFAVAITLLVLNIQVPAESMPLHALLRQQAAGYVMFVVTFVMVGIKWLNHHRLFTLMRRVDTMVNILNLALLLGICVVPFTTAIIAKYMTTPDAAFASAIYGIVWTVNGFLYTAILAYARRRGFVEQSAITGRIVRFYLVGPLAYLGAVAVSFLNIYAGIAIYVVIVSLYVPPQRISPVTVSS